MVRKLSEPVKAVLFVLSLVVAIAALLAYVQAIQPPPVQSKLVADVSLVINGPGWTVRYGPVATANDTAYSLLVEASGRLGFKVEQVRYTVPSAVFVTAINGTPNGQGGMYWQYWVNGVYGNVGADHYALSSGDLVTWRFTTDQEGALG